MNRGLARRSFFKTGDVTAFGYLNDDVQRPFGIVEGIQFFAKTSRVDANNRINLRIVVWVAAEYVDPDYGLLETVQAAGAGLLDAVAQQRDEPGRRRELSGTHDAFELGLNGIRLDKGDGHGS